MDFFTFQKSSLVFSVLFFSLSTVPMDPPKERKPKRAAVVLPMQERKPTILDVIAWRDDERNIQKRHDQIGSFLFSLPKDILINYFFIGSGPGVRNGLLKTNKTFNTMFSRENIHPFMYETILRTGLYVSQSDIKSIIIKYLYQARNIENNLCEQGVIKEMMQKLETFDYPIAGCADNKTECIKIVDWNTSRKLADVWSNLALVRESINSKKVIGDGMLPPLLFACIARSPIEVTKALTETGPIDDPTDFERCLRVCIQNNDENSLELIIGRKGKTNPYVEMMTFSMASQLIQFTVFCASDKVINVIRKHYTKLRTKYLLSNDMTIPEEKDFITMWLNSPNLISTANNLGSIIKGRQLHLEKENINRLPQLENCLKCISKNANAFQDKPPKPKSQKKLEKKLEKMMGELKMKFGSLRNSK